MAELRAARYNATAVDVRFLNSDLMTIRIRPDFEIPAHQPGQYCSLGLGYWEPRVAGCQVETLDPSQETKLVLRPYSLSHPIESAPGTLHGKTDFVEFYIVLVRENQDGRVPALTPRLFALKPGDRLKMFEKITGNYTLDPVKPDDAVVFMGTGTGEAPHNYMLWELLRRGHRGPIVSICCVRLKKDLGYLDIHKRLMERNPQYKYIPLATREPGQGKRYIQDVIESGELAQNLGGTLDPNRTHVFLCGNPKMIGVPEKNPETGERAYPATVGVIELLERRGFRADHKATKFVGSIHYEEYW
ncbi:MAG: ferredoxin--NADP reductase [Gemmataceae bacterium]